MAYDQLYNCDLCNLAFTSEQHIRIHLDGILHQKMVRGKFLQQENSTGNIFKRATREATSSPASVKIPGLGDYDEVEPTSPEIPRAVVGLRSCLKRTSSSSISSSSTSEAFANPNHNFNASSVVMSDPDAQSASILRAIKSILSSSRNSSQANSNRYSELKISCEINSPNEDGFQRLYQTKVEPERVSGVGEKKRKLNSKTVSLAVNLLDIQRDLQKPFSIDHETDSRPKHLPKAETKSRSSVQSLLSAQFDLLKSYMVEQLDSSANIHDAATDACEGTRFDGWQQSEDDSEASRNVLGFRYSECTSSELLDSECRIPFLCDNDEIVCDTAPPAARSGAANRNAKRLIGQTFRQKDVPLALSQANRNASEDFSCKTFSYRRLNVDPVGPPPLQRSLRPHAPSVRGQNLATSCLSSDDRLPNDTLDVHEYSCKNLTSGVSRRALLPTADEPWPIAGLSADDCVISGSLDDYVARMKLNLSRGLPYSSLGTSRLNEKGKFTPATSLQRKEKFAPSISSQQKEKFSPAVSSQPNIPAKKALLMTPPEPAAALETRKPLLPTPSAGLDFRPPPAANSAVGRSRPLAPNSASSNCGRRAERSIRITSPLLPNPTVEGKPRQPLEKGRQCPQPPKHHLTIPSSFFRSSDVSTTPYAKPAAAAASSAVGKKSASVSDSSVKDAITSLANPSSSSSSSSLKMPSAIEVPVVVSSTGAATTSEAYSSGVNEDLPEVEETEKSCNNQVQPQVNLQKQIKAAQKPANYSKEASDESAIISDEKLEFHGKRLDQSPEQVAKDTIDKIQLTGDAISVENVNVFHKQTEDDQLLDLGPMDQQCRGSATVGENANAQELTSEEQLDPQLKLQREIESIMQERIKDLKETLPDSMIFSINEGKIPVEFLDRISDLIPREVIDKAVNEVERSAGVTSSKMDKTKESQAQVTDGCKFSTLGMIETSAGNIVDQQVPERVPEQMPEQVSKPDGESIKAQIEVEASKTLKLEVVKNFIEGILGDFVSEDVPPVNIGVVEKLDVTDRTVALKILQETGIRDTLVIVEILNFFKTFDDELLSALMNTYDANADGRESVLYRVVEVVLKKRQEMKSQESAAESCVTVECSDKNASPIHDNRRENASNVLESQIVTDAVSNTLSQQLLDSKTSCVEKMPIGTEVVCDNSEPANLEHCAKECPKTRASSSLASDAAIVTIAVSKTDQLAISSSVRHSDIGSSCGRTELQLTTLSPCDRCDDTKVLEPRPKITEDSEMLEAESRQKQIQLGTAEEIADVSDSDLKLIFEERLCDSLESANASDSKEHSSSNNSGDTKQSVQPLSSASTVDANEGVLCAKDDSACVAVSLANSSSPQKKLSEVERLQSKRTLLPTPRPLPSMSRPDVRPLMALHDSPRLVAPVCLLGPAEASVKPQTPLHLLFSQRSPSRPVSSMPCPQSFSISKPLLPSPNVTSVQRFQFSNEEARPLVQLEVSRPLLAQRTPLLLLPPHAATLRSSQLASMQRRTLLPTPNMILTQTLAVGSQPLIGSYHPLKRQAPQLMTGGLGPPPFKRLR